MGSAPSTPNHSQEQLNDPWWPLENEHFSLALPPNAVPARVDLERINKSSAGVSDIRVDSELSNKTNLSSEEKSDKEVAKRSERSEQTLEEFKENLQQKRMARQSAVADIRNELETLRSQLAAEREVNRQLRAGVNVSQAMCDACTSTDPYEVPEPKSLCENDETGSSTASLRAQLAEVQLSLQLANADNLSLTTEMGVVRKQVASLKEVISCSKEMIKVREEQVVQLKAKLQEIENSLAERELRIMSDDLRQEYNRQLANIRNLRQLYEERARVSAAERENLLRQVSIKKDELAAETEKVKNFEERVSSLETELNATHKSLSASKIQCEEFKFENKGLKEEMAAINTLFSQMLTGFNGVNNLDIDRLTTMLEENRTLLNEMATTETDSEGACLPKLLFEIVKEANNEDDTSETLNESSDEMDAARSNLRLSSSQEIIGNLPKVWRVLMELLNHQKIAQVEFQENGQGEDCYKSIQTPTGPKVELSVSKTYIKLKDLILEKKALQKETTRLKTLNGHLERRLNDQEKRLSTVSLELTKTWHLVGKMQRQHRQLHTHEQILRYQLQQKRRHLNELKDELEYCRRKWAAARAKNAESQIQCEDLRREFASRKLQDANNSAESGYSDGPLSDDDDVDVSKKDYSNLFAASRKLERTRSQSPNRSVFDGLLKRGNSAPHIAAFLTELMHTTKEIASEVPPQNVAASSVVFEDVLARATVVDPPKEVAISTVVSNPLPVKQGLVPSRANISGVASSSSGTVPKRGVKLSRSRREEKKSKTKPEEETLEEMFYRIGGEVKEPTLDSMEDAEEKRIDRAARIQRLENQCKSLITQVIETSTCRDQLNEQLSRFQEELEPVASGSATQSTNDDGEQSTRRAERLKRLETESEQLLKRIKKTTDRGKTMTSRLDYLHSRMTSRESSFDESESARGSPKPHSNEDQFPKGSDPEIQAEHPVKLTATEEAYLARRTERIQRLEEESRQLQNAVARNTQRGIDLSSKLDDLHEKYGASAFDANSANEVNELDESKASESDLSVNSGEMTKVDPSEDTFPTDRDGSSKEGCNSHEGEDVKRDTGGNENP